MSAEHHYPYLSTPHQPPYTSPQHTPPWQQPLPSGAQSLQHINAYSDQSDDSNTEAAPTPTTASPAALYGHWQRQQQERQEQAPIGQQQQMRPLWPQQQQEQAQPGQQGGRQQAVCQPQPVNASPAMLILASSPVGVPVPGQGKGPAQAEAMSWRPAAGMAGFPAAFGRLDSGEAPLPSFLPSPYRQLEQQQLQQRAEEQQQQQPVLGSRQQLEAPSIRTPDVDDANDADSGPGNAGDKARHQLAGAAIGGFSAAMSQQRQQHASAAPADSGPDTSDLLLSPSLRRAGSVRSYSFSGGEYLSPPKAASLATAGPVSSNTGRYSLSASRTVPNSLADAAATAASAVRVSTDLVGVSMQHLHVPVASGMVPLGDITSSRLSRGVSSAASRKGPADQQQQSKQLPQQQQQDWLRLSGPASCGSIRGMTGQQTGLTTGGAAASTSSNLAGLLPWQMEEPIFDLPPFAAPSVSTAEDGLARLPTNINMPSVGPPPGSHNEAGAHHGIPTSNSKQHQHQQFVQELQQQQRHQEQQHQQPLEHAIVVGSEDADMQDEQYEQQQNQQHQRQRYGSHSLRSDAADVAGYGGDVGDGSDDAMDEQADGLGGEAAGPQPGDPLGVLLQAMEGPMSFDTCLNCTAPLMSDDDNDNFHDHDIDSVQEHHDSATVGPDGILVTGTAGSGLADDNKHIKVTEGHRGQLGQHPAAAAHNDAVCRSCGHRRASDATLMSGQLPEQLAASAAARARTVAAAGGVEAPLLAFDNALLHHVPPADSIHPERPERAAAVMARLLEAGLAAQCRRVSCRVARVDELAAVHDMQLIREVQTASKLQQQELAKAAAAATTQQQQHTQQQGLLVGVPAAAGQQQQQHPAAAGSMTAGISHGAELGAGHILDCYLGPATFQCASMAAGAAIDVAVAVYRGEAPSGAAIIRPPGHHAEGGLAMGFCYFNNAAVAARAAQTAGAGKVLVLDWDVHHGNGTQAIFENDPSVMYMSVHRYDNGRFFPGTGHPGNAGSGAGAGGCVNLAWEGPGSGDAEYIAAFIRVLLPIAYEFAPDLIIVSAGFDAAHGDPLGGCHVSPACYGHMTALLQPIAPLALLLEGGYNLAATAASVEACVRVLLGGIPGRLRGPLLPSRVGLAAINTTLAVQSRYWRCLGAGTLVMSSPPQLAIPEHSNSIGLPGLPTPAATSKTWPHPTHIDPLNTPRSRHKAHHQQQQHGQEEGWGAAVGFITAAAAGAKVGSLSVGASLPQAGMWRVDLLPPPGAGNPLESLVGASMELCAAEQPGVRGVPNGLQPDGQQQQSWQQQQQLPTWRQPATSNPPGCHAVVYGAQQHALQQQPQLPLHQPEQRYQQQQQAQQQLQLRQPVNSMAPDRAGVSGPAASQMVLPAAAAAGGGGVESVGGIGGAGSRTLVGPFAAAAGWSFVGDAAGSRQGPAATVTGEVQFEPHLLDGVATPNVICADIGVLPACGGSGGGSGGLMGAADEMLLAALRRQLQSEGGASGEMPLSAAPTLSLSSTFSL